MCSNKAILSFPVKETLKYTEVVHVCPLSFPNIFENHETEVLKLQKLVPQLSHMQHSSRYHPETKDHILTMVENDPTSTY